MRVESRDLFELAAQRNQSIPKLIKDDSYFIPANPIKTALVRAIMRISVRSCQVAGLEHFQHFYYQHPFEPRKIIDRHISDADHLARLYWLEKNGFPSAAKDLVYPAGLNMRDRWYIRFFMGSLHASYIATPTDLQYIEETLRDNCYHGQSLTEGQREILEKYRANLNALNKRTGRKLRTLEKQAGKIVVFYPEATRSLDGYLLRPPEKVSAYVKDGWILPMSSDGIQTVYPARQNFHLFTKRGINRADLDIRIGEAFPAEIADQVDTTLTFQGRPATPADYVAAKIAVLRPEKVRPDFLEFCEKLLAA